MCPRECKIGVYDFSQKDRDTIPPYSPSISCCFKRYSFLCSHPCSSYRSYTYVCIKSSQDLKLTKRYYPRLYFEKFIRINRNIIIFFEDFLDSGNAVTKKKKILTQISYIFFFFFTLIEIRR